MILRLPFQKNKALYALKLPIEIFTNYNNNNNKYNYNIL